MKKLLTFIFLLFTIPAYAATYHVATDGSGDFTTIAQVNAATFSPGDKILFRRGDTWREQLVPDSGSASEYITYGSYGSGDKPKLLGSITKNNLSDWTDEGGNIWRLDTTALSGSELLSNPSFESNTSGWSLYRNTRVGTDTTGSGRTTTAGEFDSGVAGYKLVCVNNGDSASDIQLYTTTTVSITNGNWYCLTFRAKASSAFNITSIRLMTSASPWNIYYYTSTTQTCAITDVFTKFTIYYKANTTTTTARLTWYLGNLIPDGATLYIDTLSFQSCGRPLNVDVGNLIFDNEDHCGIKVWNEIDLDTQDEFWYDEDNDILKMYSVGNPASIYTNIECALHENIIDGSISYVTFENLDLRYGARHGIGLASVVGITIRDCEFYFIGGGDQYGGTSVVRLGNGIEFYGSHSDCLCERNYFYQMYDEAITFQQDGNGVCTNIIVRNNIALNTHLGIRIWKKNGYMDGVYVYNNTILYSGYEWSYAQRDVARSIALGIGPNTGSTTKNVYVYNNLCFETKDTLYETWDVNLSDINLDYNLYYTSNGYIARRRSTGTIDASYSTLQDWQSYSNQDAHSIAQDPLLSSRYRLLSGSPAINAGATGLNVTDDYLGNPRDAQPDMGCFESGNFLHNATIKNANFF